MRNLEQATTRFFWSIRCTKDANYCFAFLFFFFSSWTGNLCLLCMYFIRLLQKPMDALQMILNK